MYTVLKCGLNTQNAVTILTSTEAENIYITEIVVVVNAMLNKQKIAQVVHSENFGFRWTLDLVVYWNCH